MTDVHLDLWSASADKAAYLLCSTYHNNRYSEPSIGTLVFINTYKRSFSLRQMLVHTFVHSVDVRPKRMRYICMHGARERGGAARRGVVSS